MRTNRPYVQIEPDELERIRQIDLLSYLREFEPSNLVSFAGVTTWQSSNIGCFFVAKILEITNCPNYCTGEERFTFIKLPKCLVENECFIELSMDMKALQKLEQMENMVEE